MKPWQALLASGDLAGAAEHAVAAVSAPRSLSFGFPLAIGLETAGLVALAADPAVRHEVGELLGVGADLRERGDRPALPSLRGAVDDAVVRAGTRGRGPLDRARLDHACSTALGLLERVLPR